MKREPEIQSVDPGSELQASEASSWRGKGATHPGAGYDAYDEIDLVDILAGIWRIRTFVIGGFLAGILVGGGVAFFGIQDQINSRLPVTVDNSSLPAISDQKKIKDGYVAALSSVNGAFAAFSTLFETSPTLAGQLKGKGLTVSELVDMQTSANKPDRVPLRVTETLGANDFIIEFRAPVSLHGQEGAQAMIAAVNAAGNVANQNAVAMTREVAVRLVEDANEIHQQLQEEYARQRFDRETEATAIRLRLAQLEYRLLQKARAGGITHERIFGPTGSTSGEAFAQDMRRLTISIAPDSQRGARWRETDSTLDIDRVVRILSVLKEEGKVPQAESDELQREIARIQVDNTRNESRFAGVRSVNESTLAQLGEAMEKRATAVDRANLFLPLYTYNEAFLQELDGRGGLAQVESKRLIVALGGMFLGTMLGTALGALFLFIRKNRARLRESGL